MDVRLTDDQRVLQAGVRDFLEGTHGPEVLRRLDAEGARNAGLWQGLVDMGLTGLLVPEAEGGLGLGLVEGVLVAVELGRAAVAEPIADTALIAVPWLAAAGRTERFAEIAGGTLKVALAHPVNAWIADADGAGLVLNGTAGDVLTSIDPLRRLSAIESAEADDRLFDLAALMTAGQLLGTAERMLALAVDYAGSREQFGQPIGAFQAVKHHAADIALRTEFARPTVLRAAWALQEGDARAGVFVSQAKLAATDAALFAAETAIQIHGAMGYTYEVDLHFWAKRAWALAGAWGDRGFHLRRLDHAIFGGTLPLGPGETYA